MEGTMGASATNISAEDLAELAQLRADRAAKEKAEQEEAERNKPVPSHYLHLDDGSTVESQGLMTNYNGHQVMSWSIIPEVVKNA